MIVYPNGQDLLLSEGVAERPIDIQWDSDFRLRPPHFDGSYLENFMDDTQRPAAVGLESFGLETCAQGQNPSHFSDLWSY